jgi:hypothetical protein
MMMMMMLLMLFPVPSSSSAPPRGCAKDRAIGLSPTHHPLHSGAGGVEDPQWNCQSRPSSFFLRPLYHTATAGRPASGDRAWRRKLNVSLPSSSHLYLLTNITQHHHRSTTDDIRTTVDNHHRKSTASNAYFLPLSPHCSQHRQLHYLVIVPPLPTTTLTQ